MYYREERKIETTRHNDSKKMVGVTGFLSQGAGIALVVLEPLIPYGKFGLCAPCVFYQDSS